MAKAATTSTGPTKKSTTRKVVDKPANAKPEKKSKRGTRSKRAGVKNRDPSQRAPLKARTFPIVRETFAIEHFATQDAYDRYFDSFRSCFFHTTSILGRSGLHNGADRVNQHIIDLIDSVRGEIEAETARIAKLVEAQTGSGKIPKSTPQVEQRTAEVPSFIVRKYLSLFPAADRLIDAIVYAETLGIVSWQRRSELLRLVKKYIRSPFGRYQSIMHRLAGRQRKEQTTMAVARKEMLAVLEEALTEQGRLQQVQKKRPMKKKTGTEG